jgi:hypothetical protein
LTRADLLDILGITGFAPQPPPPAPRVAPRAAPPFPDLVRGPAEEPYDPRERGMRGWLPLTPEQIASIRRNEGVPSNMRLNNADGVSVSRRVGNPNFSFGGRKTYRKQKTQRRKTKKHI